MNRAHFSTAVLRATLTYCTVRTCRIEPAEAIEGVEGKEDIEGTESIKWGEQTDYFEDVGARVVRRIGQCVC